MIADPENRNRFIAAARLRAAEEGLAGCDPQRVAQELGLDPDEISCEFPDPDSLAEAIILFDLAAQSEEVVEAQSSSQPHSLRLGAMLRGWVMTAWDDSQRASQRILTDQAFRPALAEALRTHREWMIERFASTLEDGLEAGEFDLQDSKRMARLIHLLGSALVPPQCRDCPDDLPLTLQDLVDLLLRALEPPMMIAD